jgi:hypothetical protein
MRRRGVWVTSPRMPRPLWAVPNIRRDASDELMTKIRDQLVPAVTASASAAVRSVMPFSLA